MAADPPAPHRTAAWPLAILYTVLAVYASLYPFTDWRDQGVLPWAYLTAPLPRYWTGFDVAINLMGYAPLGFLLGLGALRTGHTRWALPLALVGALGLSAAMEALQSYLPARVPSNVDLALNTLGGLVGGLVALGLDRLGVLARWSRVRTRWFHGNARGPLVLLALWPFALLFPPPVPLGLGQVMERVEAGLATLLEDTPFLDWLPVRDIELQPLVPSAELLCVVFGALAPILLGYSVLRTLPQRVVAMLGLLALGVTASTLSAALSYGPPHAWAWLSLPVQVGLVAALLVAALLLPVPRRTCAALALLVLAVSLSLLNQAPTSAYFAQTLQTWEQGRFIRFHGLAQWLGWLWPYAALVAVVARLSAREK